MISKPGFDLGFLKRVYITTAVAGTILGLMLFAKYTGEPRIGCSFFAGTAFGILNLWAWAKLILSTVKLGEVSLREALLTFIIKFPIILALFLGLLFAGWVEPKSYVAGFSLTYAVILLKALAIIIFNPSPKPSGEMTGREGRKDDGDSI